MSSYIDKYYRILLTLTYKQLDKVLEEYPEFKEIVARNIQEVEEYLRYYSELDPHSVHQVRFYLRYILEKVDIPERLKSKVVILS